jgi:FMN-dependent dehydrogenase
MKTTHGNATGDPVNVCEFEALARYRIESSAYDYYAGAAADERTLAEDRLGFDRVVFRPRVLIDVTHRLSSELLGQSVRSDFKMSVYRDRELTRDLVGRAESSCRCSSRTFDGGGR